jgi:hypothetical protein
MLKRVNKIEEITGIVTLSYFIGVINSVNAIMKQIIKKYVDTTDENKETIRNEEIIKI